MKTTIGDEGDDDEQLIRTRASTLDDGDDHDRGDDEGRKRVPRRGVPEMKAAEQDVTKSRMGTPASIIASVVALMAALIAPSRERW
jgi:hypothetical protein